MNKKGFTLTELIAIIVILGVLMTVAIPNVLSILERNKALSMIEDAKKFIAEVEYKIRSDTSIELPTENAKATIIKLSYLDTTDLDTSSYGISYDKNTSFIMIGRNDGNNTYYANLNAIMTDTHGKVTSNSRAIPYATYTELNGDNTISLIKKNAEDFIVSVPSKDSTVTITKNSNNYTYTIIDVK